MHSFTITALKLRPEIQEFRLGVQKSQEAIDNSIGEKAGIRLEKRGDLSFFIEEQKPDASRRREQELLTSSKTSQRGDKKKRRAAGNQSMDSRTVKQLLGELYADKEYLEKLLVETEGSSKSKTKDEVIELTTVCLDYLDTRTEFWSQQQPTYSRDRDRRLQSRGATASRASVKGPGGQNPSQWILDNLQWIDTAMNEKKYKEALSRSIEVINQAKRLSDTDVPSRKEFIANAHSYAGNAQLELGQYKDALDHHDKDLKLSNKQQFNFFNGSIFRIVSKIETI